MKNYFLNVTTIKIEGKIIPVYGITFKGYYTKKLFNISTDEKAIENLIALCNEEQLDPIHLEEIVENFITTVHTQYCM